MKTRTFPLLLPALLIGALAALPGDTARADEKARAGVWVFDVRIVRVDSPTLEGAEKQSVFEQAEGTTVPMGWPQVLAALKQRGSTTILIDQRVTALDGRKVKAENVIEHPILMVNTSDDNNTQLRQASIKKGCSVELTATATELMYTIDTRWALVSSPLKTSRAPPQMLTRWMGAHPPLTGDTLVLHSREQIDQLEGGGQKSVELYALITGRFIAK